MIKKISYIIACIVSISLFYTKQKFLICIFSPISKNENVILFFASLVTFCIVFTGSYIILERINKKPSLKNKNLDNYLSQLYVFIVVAIFVYLLKLQFLNSFRLVGYMDFNGLSIKFILCIVLLLFVLSLLFGKIVLTFKMKTSNRKIWLALGLMTAFLVGWFFYAPNALIYNYNYSAYYNSIYIHQQGVPFSSNFFSIYGHYSIFWRPIFYFVKMNIHTIALITATIGFLSVLNVIYVMYNFVKTPFVRLLGLIILIFPFVGFIYPQAYPHRLFFPSIIMLLGTYVIKNNEKKQNMFLIFGYIISALGIIWNSETGIIVLISWFSLHMYLVLFQIKFSFINLIKVGLPIIMTIFSFLCAWGFVNIYNVAIGGESLSIYYFLFPLLEESYMNGILHIDIPLFWNYWQPILLLFLFFIGDGIVCVINNNNKTELDQSKIFNFFISVLGLGQLMYFMNRGAYLNILLCYYQLILLVIFILDFAIKNKCERLKKYDTVRKIVFSCSLTMLLFLSVLTFANVKNTFFNHINLNINVQQMNDDIAYIKQVIPADTPIVGVSAASLGIALGWKNELGFIDFPDLFMTNNRAHVIDTLVVYGKPFVIEKGYFEYFKGIPGVFYIPECEKFKTIESRYNVIEISELKKTERLLYLIPK